MKRIIVGLLMALVLVFAGFSPAMAGEDVDEPGRTQNYEEIIARVPPPDDCVGAKQLRADNWAENVQYHTPTPPRGNWYTVRLTATLVYYYCPNGVHPAKLTPVEFDFCYSHLDSTNGGPAFDGVKFNPYLYDSNETTNPPETIVPDDGSVQNCKSDNIAKKWFELYQAPKWKVTSWVKLIGWPDHEKVFNIDGSEAKLIRPNYDVALGPWVQ